MPVRDLDQRNQPDPVPDQGKENEENLYDFFIPVAPRPTSKIYARLAIFSARRVAMRPLVQQIRWRWVRNPPPFFAPNVACAPLARNWRPMMLDAMYLAIGLAFLAAAVLYVVACDHL
jgi:hypothetical protein